MILQEQQREYKHTEFDFTDLQLYLKLVRMGGVEGWCRYRMNSLSLTISNSFKQQVKDFFLKQGFS